MVRFVESGHLAQEPAGPGERERRCLQHQGIRFERFDRARGAYLEFDPKLGPTNIATARAEHE